MLGIEHQADAIGLISMNGEQAERRVNYRFYMSLLLSLCLCCCNESNTNDSTQYSSCFSVREFETSKSLRYLQLVENGNTNRHRSCTDIFDILAPETPDPVRKIKIFVLELNVADLLAAREKCGYEGFVDNSFWRREVSEMMLNCPNFYATKILGSKIKKNVLLGDFIPSDYRNNDRSVAYWPGPKSTPPSMLAGVYESIEFGVIPVCFLFNESPGVNLNRQPDDLHSPEVVDAIEGCINRFSLLN